MKPQLILLASIALLPYAGRAQGTFIYDQQSSVEGNYTLMSFADVEAGQTAQSFTPTLDSVGFIRIVLNDGTPGNTIPGLIFVSLHSGSPTGPLLASTEPVLVPVGTQGPVTFYFATPVPVTPGTSYYFGPRVQSGNTWGCNVGAYNYAGGMAFNGGIAFPAWSLWFREGIVVPEPSAGLLLLLGLGASAFARIRWRHFPS